MDEQTVPELTPVTFQRALKLLHRRAVTLNQMPLAEAVVHRSEGASDESWLVDLDGFLSDSFIEPLAGEYLRVVERIQKRIKEEDNDELARVLDMEKSSVYNKQRGIKSLTYNDVDLITVHFRWADERNVYLRYTAMRDGLCGQIEAMPFVNETKLVDRVGLTYLDYFRRKRDPTMWRPVELINVSRALMCIRDELIYYLSTGTYVPLLPNLMDTGKGKRTKHAKTSVASKSGIKSE